MVVALMSHLDLQKEPFHACNHAIKPGSEAVPDAVRESLGPKKRAVWRANDDLDNLTSEKTSSVETAVSPRRDEASCVLLMLA